MSKLPVIAIVGRANAGKSTLFNFFVGRMKAIVHDKPGVTRDRHYSKASFKERSFTIIDTGGFETTDTPELPPSEVRAQIEYAIEEANGIIFLVDGRQPITNADKSLAQVLRESGKPFVLAVNKIDSPAYEAGLYDYYELGIEPTVAISATQATNIEEMLSALFGIMPKEFDTASKESGEQDDESANTELAIAVIGKPNVGKSTFVNAILGYERSIVSDMPGTTRDAIDTPLSYKGTDILLVDTAGIRRRSKIKETTEYFSVKRALRAIDRAKAIIFLLDATDEVSQQDKRIAGYAEEIGRAVVIGANKWDLASKKFSIKDFEKETYYQFKHLDYAPIITVSAKESQRVFTLLEKAIDVARASDVKVPTSLFNRFLEQLVSYRPPPRTPSGKQLKFYFGAQVGTCPPRFEIVANYPEKIHFSYQRFMVNSIRDAFGFVGNPIKIHYKTRDQKFGKGDEK